MSLRLGFRIWSVRRRKIPRAAKKRSNYVRTNDIENNNKKKLLK